MATLLLRLLAGSALVSETRRALANAAVPQPRETVDCHVDARLNRRSLVYLTSDGLENNELRNGLRELVLRLPDSAWPRGGAARKRRAAARSLSDLEAVGFREPDLYKGLRVLLLEDGCLLKEQFWNPAHANFSLPGTINYHTVITATSASLARPFLGRLEGGFCVDHSRDIFGGMGDLGFEATSFSHFSILDRFASDDVKTAIFELATSPWPLSASRRVELEAALRNQRASPSSRAAAEETAALLSDADIVLVNGGNADLATYILQVFGALVTKDILLEVRSGSLIYVGRSAGSMAGSAGEAITFDSNPLLMDVLLRNNTAGLGLAGICAIRPHFTAFWDQTSRFYEHGSGVKVVRLPFGEALQCVGPRCTVVGLTSHTAPSAFDGPNDPRIIRLFEGVARQVHHAPGFLAEGRPPLVLV